MQLRTNEAVAAGRIAVALEPGNWRHQFRLGVAAWGDEVLSGWIERGGWRAVALLRLIPIMPHSLANYGLGLTALPLGAYRDGAAPHPHVPPKPPASTRGFASTCSTAPSRRNTREQDGTSSTKMPKSRSRPRTTAV